MYRNVTPITNYVLFLDLSLLNSSTVHLKPLEVSYEVTPARSARSCASELPFMALCLLLRCVTTSPSKSKNLLCYM